MTEVNNAMDNARLLDAVTRDYYRVQQEYNNAKNKVMALIFFVATVFLGTGLCMHSDNKYALFVAIVGMAILFVSFVQLTLMLRTNEVRVLESEYFVQQWMDDENKQPEIEQIIMNAYSVCVRSMREVNGKIYRKIDAEIINIMLGTLTCFIGIVYQMVSR